MSSSSLCLQNGNVYLHCTVMLFLFRSVSIMLWVWSVQRCRLCADLVFMLHLTWVSPSVLWQRVSEVHPGRQRERGGRYVSLLYGNLNLFCFVVFRTTVQHVSPPAAEPHCSSTQPLDASCEPPQNEWDASSSSYESSMYRNVFCSSGYGKQTQRLYSLM